MPRYYLANIEENEFKVSGDEAHHLLRVMRKGLGDTVELADGQGGLYCGQINQVLADRVDGIIIESIDLTTESATPIVLCQALPKGDKMDEVIRKGTEIGVAEFVPFISCRCVARPDAKGAAKRLERWRRIAEEAAKQAGRTLVPTVHPLTDWNGVWELTSGSSVLLAWEAEHFHGIREGLIRGKGNKTSLVVGSEGGFDPTEVESARNRGSYTVSLGPRILRAETAGPVLAALVLYELGEMDPKRQEE